MEVLSAYEQQRLATIEANRAMLQSLGLLEEIQNIRRDFSPATKTPKPKKRPNQQGERHFAVHSPAPE